MGPKAKGKMSLRLGNDPAFEGRPGPLSKNQLPNYQEVGLALEWAKLECGSESEAVNLVTNDLVDLYARASVPTINTKKIREKVKQVMELKKKRMKELVVDKRRDHVTVLGKWKKKNRGIPKLRLQDILKKHFHVASKKDVDASDMEFLKDQQGPRLMVIGNIDMKATNRNIRKEI